MSKNSAGTKKGFPHRIQQDDGIILADSSGRSLSYNVTYSREEYMTYLRGGHRLSWEATLPVLIYIITNNKSEGNPASSVMTWMAVCWL